VGYGKAPAAEMGWTAAAKKKLVARGRRDHDREDLQEVVSPITSYEVSIDERVHGRDRFPKLPLS